MRYRPTEERMDTNAPPDEVAPPYQAKPAAPTIMILLRKAVEQMGLFDMPVTVGAHQRGGKPVGPYVATRRKKAAQGKPPAQKERKYPAGPAVGESMAGRASLPIATLSVPGVTGAIELRLIRWRSSDTPYGFAVYVDGKKDWSAPFNGVKGDMLIRQAADLALDYLNADMPADRKIKMSILAQQEKPTAAPAEGSQSAADRELRLRLKDLQGRRFKSHADEKMIKIIQGRLASDPSKWAPGAGVGYRVHNQINRGFRIVKIDPDEKLALVAQVADTGITTSGGDNDRIGARWVHIADLVRDNRYSAK